MQVITITVTTSNRKRVCAVENEEIPSSRAVGSRRRREIMQDSHYQLNSRRSVQILEQNPVSGNVHPPRIRDQIHRDRDSHKVHRGRSRRHPSSNDGDFPASNEEQRVSRHESDYDGSRDERRMSRHEEEFPVPNEQRRKSRHEGDFPVSNKRQRMSRHEEDFPVSNERQRMSLHEEDFPVSNEQRRTSRHEGDFPVSNERQRMSRHEEDFPVSNERQRMSRHEEDFPVSNERQRMSRHEEDFPVSNERQRMSRHEEDFPVSHGQRRTSRHEEDFPVSNERQRMSRHEEDFAVSNERQRMSRHKEDFPVSNERQRMSRHEEDFPVSNEQRRTSRHEGDFPVSHEERRMSDSLKLRDERLRSRNKKDSHLFQEEQTKSNHKRDTHGSHDKTPMSHQDIGSHVSRDGRTMAGKYDKDSHVSRDEQPMSHHERGPHGSQDEQPMSHNESGPHGSRDKIPMSHHERGPHGSRDKIPMSHQERGPHGSRNKTPMSHHKRGPQGSRDKTPMSHQERGSHDQTPMSRQDRYSHMFRDKSASRNCSDTIESVAPCALSSHASEASEGSTNPKKKRRESEPSSSPRNIPALPDVAQNLRKRRREESILNRAMATEPKTNDSEPGTSGLSLLTDRTPFQRKRKRNDIFENEAVPEKKEKRDIKPIGYKALENICSIEDENEAMLELVKIEERYIALLNSEDEIREDLFKLVINSLLIVVESTNRKTSAHVILHSSHKQLLGTHFPKFIFQLPQMNCNSKDELAEVVFEIIIIFEALLQLFPQDKTLFYRIQMLVTSLKDKIDPLLQQGKARDLIFHRITSLMNSKDPFHKESATDDTTDPPDDFRKMSIVPVEADFKEHRPFLRANVIHKAYRDTEHYLDVQFRLLREDFIMPLREGIQELRRKGNDYHGRKQEEENTSQNTFIYQDVRIVNPVCHRSGGVYRIQINNQAGKLKHVNWKKFTIKRLKFGALVCLSADAFIDTLLFATVENRDCDLDCGLLELRFENCDIQAMQDAIEKQYVFQMIESEAYFEAYRHNLSALQAMNEEKLPFKECIVHCKYADVPPSYIVEDTTDDEPQHMSEDVWSDQSSSDDSYFDTEESSADLPSKGHKVKYMDMFSIADPEFLEEHEMDVSRVPVQNTCRWPCKEALGLDESQYWACQLALNNRFALIQGPPGTGKTFVGLKIAHALLDNRELWCGEDVRSPILMVSYTNHALDQFLMGLNNREGVVRVGGRSKEDKLKDCNIKELRAKRRKGKVEDDNKRERGRIWKERREIEETHFPNEASRIIADGHKGVLSVSLLKGFMKERHLGCFTSDSQNMTEDVQLLQWLGVKQKPKEQRQHGEKHQVFQTEDFRKIVSAAREFEVEDEDNDLSNKQQGSVVSCYVKDAKNPGELYSNLQGKETMSDADEESVRDVFRLPRDKRWDLYRSWRLKLEQNCQKRITDSQGKGYETLLMRLSEINADEDYYILREAKVIAMTTTCAARYRDILQRVKPRIVLVEEAAEVLEAHILTSLPLECDHVILIGDHQQLRPSCTVYELAKKYNLNISMFERLVKHRMPCVKLTVQHRMRPEIASLMKHIYKDLTNHRSVHNYDNVLGFQHNLFFIDHRHSESDSEDSFSHFNKHEAQFIVKLCRYLIQQGYGPSQVTILTPYLGQMFMIRYYMDEEGREDLKEIRLTTIDNYQGEENDIILLSLVRSNDTGHVGFVNDINRACVALSRARMGLYVIGNFDLLSAKSGIWKKVVGDVRKNGRLGKELPLQCQRHKTKILITNPKDFQSKAPCGGCRLDCEYRLDCGHACTLPCHPDDQEHKTFRCGKPCSKTIRGCTEGHICRNTCGQECEPRCLYPVQMTLPCSHVKNNARCSDNPYKVKCDERCLTVLRCGHQCQARCGEPCTTACQELVQRSDWPCGHGARIACSATPLNCRGPCGETSCGHECSGSCGECLQGRVHRRCKKTCDRVLVCGHKCRANCTITCPPCTNKCETKCKHSKCGKICGEPCAPCSHPCEWACVHFKCNMKCGEICDRPRCTMPCRKRLQCKHICRGLCNEPCICVECERSEIQELFGTEDFEDENVRFIQLRECKHIFEVNALDHWMDQTNDDSEENNSIQPKVCPSCKTPIRTTMRYNNVNKKQQEDIERVKAKILKENQPLSEERRNKLRTKLTEYLRDSNSSSSAGRERSHNHELLKRLDKAKHVLDIIPLENQVELLTRCFKLIKKATETKPEIADQTSVEMKDVSLSILVLKYLKEKRIIGSVEREIEDNELEMTRQKVVIEVCALLTETTNRGIRLSDEDRSILVDIRNTLSRASRIEKPNLTSYLGKLQEIRSRYPVDPPTREEQDQIIKAMGLSKGHWYKCPQGHVYAIGECGAAMERGTCPECRGVIGGAFHRLVRE